MKKKYLILLIIIWITLVASSLLWYYSLIESGNDKIVLNKSQSFFKQILSARKWNAQHGGIYVPVTETTQPNPYLKDSLRDLETVNGMELTMINPAYMTRQIADLNLLDYNLKFHITSLNPIRPDNKADSWETKALKLFEDGNPEIMELATIDSEKWYRYMAPLYTHQSCLKCHAKQGYKVGDIRGGISISYPADLYLNAMYEQIFSISLIHFIVLIVGIVGLLVFYRYSKKYISTIERKNEELVHINTTKDKFFTIIAHDLRSPFNSIIGYSKLLIDDYDNLTDNQKRKFINEMGISTKSSYQLLENLLLWAHSQRDGIEITKTELNIHTLISDAIDPLLSSARMKNITIEIKAGKEITAYADTFTTLTIVSNLFSNAVKFTPIEGEIIIDAEESGNEVKVSITDNGIGIEEEKLTKLFLIEEDISTPGTNREKGTGLGLILCKEFVEINGGKIWVNSVPGKGTKVTFTLPVTKGYYL